MYFSFLAHSDRFCYKKCIEEMFGKPATFQYLLPFDKNEGGGKLRVMEVMYFNRGIIYEKVFSSRCYRP